MYSIEDHVDHVVFTLLSHDDYMHYMYLLYVIVYFILHNSVNVDMCLYMYQTWSTLCPFHVSLLVLF